MCGGGVADEEAYVGRGVGVDKECVQPPHFNPTWGWGATIAQNVPMVTYWGGCLVRSAAQFFQPPPFCFNACGAGGG